MKKKNYPLRIFLIFVLSLFIGICSAQITTYPNTTDFELGIGGDWKNSPYDDIDFNHQMGAGTPSSGTGPQTFPY